MDSEKAVELRINQYTVLFDAEDAKIISPHKWTIHFGWRNTPYAVARIQGKDIRMHRLLLNAPKGMLVDHKNHNTLDNRRENIRLATRAQNMWNRKKTCGVSKYKGVCWDPRRGRWRAQVTLNNKRVFVKAFISEDDAARYYNEKARELYGEFACLNIIGD